MRFVQICGVRRAAERLRLLACLLEPSSVRALCNQIMRSAPESISQKALDLTCNLSGFHTVLFVHQTFGIHLTI